MNKRKEILVISELVPPKPGGAGRGIHDYLINNRNMFRFTLISSVKEKIYKRKKYEYLDSYIFFKSYRSANTLKKIYNIILHFIKVMLFDNSLKKKDCLLIVSPSFYTLPFAIKAYFNNVRIVIQNTLVGHDDPMTAEELSYLNPKKYSQKIQYSFCNRIISISVALKDRSGKLVSKTTVIPYSVSRNFIHKNNVFDLRTKYKIDDNDKIVLWCGGLNKRKGFDEFLTLIKDYYFSYDEGLHFLIVGPSFFEFDEKFVTDYLCENNVPECKFTYVGYVEDTYQYFCSSDVFILLSNREGLGLVFLEAMYTNCYVICKHLEGITNDLFSDYKKSYVIKDAKKEMRKLIKLLHDIPKKNGEKNIVAYKKYSPKSISKKMNKELLSVITPK